MNEPQIARHKTALTRTALSRPIAVAMSDNLITVQTVIFDYGCGKGDDLRSLVALGYNADGWDPTHRADATRSAADVVNLGYVVNVIERPAERDTVLRSAWELAKDVLIVSARMSWDGRGLIARPMGDGVVTRTGTFQKFFEQAELASWIEQILGVRPHAAAPGIFYVFRRAELAQRFTASRVYSYRPRIKVDPHVQYESLQETLAPFLDFMRTHARAPSASELPEPVAQSVSKELGSLRRAEALIRKVTSNDLWDSVSIQRRTELLVYVALSRFGRRPVLSQLDPILAKDIKVVFGTYREACAQADHLLAVCGDQTLLYMNARSSTVGKQTPSSLYVHRSAMARVAPVLQVYEGCARVLAGTVPSANLIKLAVAQPKVSYLTYPDFDRNAHPTLSSAVTVDLRALTVEVRDYSRSDNPPLLHRKEEFVSIDHPHRAKYERLTKAEKNAGLYNRPEKIGTLQGWLETLAVAGLTVRGHRLIRAPKHRGKGSGRIDSGTDRGN